MVASIVFLPSLYDCGIGYPVNLKIMSMIFEAGHYTPPSKPGSMSFPMVFSI